MNKYFIRKISDYVVESPTEDDAIQLVEWNDVEPDDTTVEVNDVEYGESRYSVSIEVQVVTYGENDAGYVEEWLDERIDDLGQGTDTWVDSVSINRTENMEV